MLADSTARTTAAVDAMLASMVPASVANADAEAAVLAEAAARDGVELAAWDWAFYSEQVRAERYAVDTTALRPYFELDRVLVDGVFHAAELLYGYRFTAAAGPARATTRTCGCGRSATPTVRRSASTSATSSPVRASAGGAWMSSFVRQSRLLDTRPVVVNNLNVSRAPAGQPTLLTLDEVNTLFHEFGHALHGLSSAVTYPRFSGTSVPRDFVEFPSQVNEMWALWPQVLGNYARHVETGEPLPSAVVEAIDAAAAVGRGLRHPGVPGRDPARPGLAPDHPGIEVGDPIAFERRRSRRPASPSALVPPRYRTTYFQHIFAGGYAAGYYSYIWSEVLDADTVEWFKENGGLRRENGDAFRAEAALRRRLGRPAGRLPRRPWPRRRPRPAAPPPRPREA